MTTEELRAKAREMALRDLDANIARAREMLASGDLDDYARQRTIEEIEHSERSRENIPSAILWFYEGIAAREDGR